ncbi:YeeE/YedE thiosulfate transporter family protein [Candidatus Bacteroides intestinigallinarum]|uniref:YeeE/YedE thiosulfate transporter family protein n=1 Tax=Candidatus Bacteroides intestinigallinarum TaxID=2838470 RepID=UPI0022E2F6EE|nr:YeeE/YedE thiosulfate transporter family protein [Candidatus Bacteroides intestinigallinarum]
MGNLIIIIIGIVFGFLISYVGLNKFNTIAGLSVLKDFTVAKTIMLVIGLGSILLMIEMADNEAVFHVKSLYLVGTALGGVIFGIGMAILGYCPGTLPISLGQGSLDALWGIIGGLAGGILYTVLYPFIIPLLGENLGKGTLFTLMGSEFSVGYVITVILIGVAMIAGAFILHQLDVKNGNPSRRWVITGIGLALLNTLLFYQGWQNKPLGASTSYPFVGDSIACLTDNSYYPGLIGSGSWQVWFLLGALIAGFVYALITGTFRWRLIQECWAEYKGESKGHRIVWAFVGGVILIFGARMADGCTSGHIISGGMQFAASSYVFAIFTFIGFLATGYLFYTRNKKEG